MCLNDGICVNEDGSYECKCGKDGRGKYFSGKFIETFHNKYISVNIDILRCIPVNNFLEKVSQSAGSGSRCVTFRCRPE